MADPAESTAVPFSPLVVRRWLGSELVRLRTAADLTQRDAAAALQCSVAKVSYLESGDRAIAPDELETLLEHYEVSNEDWPRFLEAAEQAGQPGWWDHWSDEDIPRGERRYIGLEDGATRLRSYLPSIVHGLLQTPEYTRAVLRAYKTFPEERISRLVELRRVRQAVLTRASHPLEAHVILDEAVARRQVGGPETLRDQLLYIAELASRHESLTIQVLPFQAGAHGAYVGPFSILDFGPSADAGLVYLEGFIEARYLEARADVYRHSSLFDRLSEMALTPDSSIAMLGSLVE